MPLMPFKWCMQRHTNVKYHFLRRFWKRINILFLIVWNVCMAMWQLSFNGLFSLSSPCQSMMMSSSLSFKFNLGLHLLILICFVFVLFLFCFNWFFLRFCLGHFDRIWFLYLILTSFFWFFKTLFYSNFVFNFIFYYLILIYFYIKFGFYFLLLFFFYIYIFYCIFLFKLDRKSVV